MMLMPRRNEFDLFDNMFDDPFFNRKENKLMKTDIKENKDNFEIAVDLPGYEKENIQVDVSEGYITINAKMDQKNDEEDENGKFIRRERYSGECSRSFYVGEDIEPDDVKASFKNGTLTLKVPKKEEKEQIPEKKYIEIEG